MNDQVQDPIKGRLLTAAQVAELWNQRAEGMGYKTNYTRFSVRQRHRKGKKGLIPAMETAVGHLYWEKDAQEIELQPNKSRVKNS